MCLCISISMYGCIIYVYMCKTFSLFSLSLCHNKHPLSLSLSLSFSFCLSLSLFFSLSLSVIQPPPLSLFAYMVTFLPYIMKFINSTIFNGYYISLHFDSIYMYLSYRYKPLFVFQKAGYIEFFFFNFICFILV